MSAYSVPDNQIHVMVSYILKNLDHGSDTFYLPPFSSIHVGQVWEPNMLNIQGIWDTLRKANDASLESRYGDGEPSPLTPFVCVKGLPDPVSMIRIVQNFEYQACEYDDWYTSKAKAICDGIISICIRKLPGMDNAPWGFDQDIEPDDMFCAPTLSDTDEVIPGKVYRLF